MNNQKNVNVLVTEDDYLVSRMIKGTLEEAGYTVIGEAADGRTAVEMTHVLQPDAIIMDIEMPDMNGIDAAQQIQVYSPTPIVILTAYDTPKLIKQAGQAGVGAFLRKPTTSRELESAITIAMARFDDLMQLRFINETLQIRNRELQEALNQIDTLRGLLPICAHCKKIRDDQGYWQEVEVYIKQHSQADFSHGLCPDCLGTLYSEYYKDEK